MNFFERLYTQGIHYNENQIMAITHIDGPLLVAAGPGSGKTSVITARTAYLIQKGNINPANILVITFTRASANEMKQRFQNFPGITEDYMKNIEFGTFHSTFYKIINTYYGRRLKVLESGKIRIALKEMLRSINEPYDDDIIQEILNDISVAHFAVNNPEDYKSSYLNPSKFIYIYKQYEDFKHSLNCIDFDDMMILCKKILESNKDFYLQCKNKYKYFLIDEFQDTCKIQYDIIKMLSYPDNNLCVVGDDDQSIYGFRGAIPDCLVNFEKSFKSCKSVILNLNYRSTEQIVNFSSKVISNNIKRKEKSLKAYKQAGHEPLIIFPQDEIAEASYIADKVEELHSLGYNYNDFAVLYRVNTQSMPIIDELVKRGIPFNIRDNTKSFFEHWICKDLTSYMKLALNCNDCPSLNQILNRPVRYIPRDTITRALSYFSTGSYDIIKSFENCGLKDYQMQKIKDLFNDLKYLKTMKPGLAVNFIRTKIGYETYTKNYSQEYNIENDEFINIMDEYEISATSFDSISEFLTHIRNVSLQLYKDKTDIGKKIESMTLTTIHSAKGLEFRCVFIIGVIEGFLPHAKSLHTGENIEEERRLFYVAITRAKDSLYIFSPKKRIGKSSEISRFLTEIIEDKEVLTSRKFQMFKSGELLSHKFFGTGRIVNIYNNIIEVKFNSSGIKQLDIKTCIENKLIDRL